MTKILYERPDGEVRGDCSIEIIGDGADVLRAVIQIILSLEMRCGLNVAKFAASLPMLLALEKDTVEHSTLYDFNAMRRKEGGAHE